MTECDFEKVSLKFRNLINIESYFDYILLDFENFTKKYGSYGWSFNNYFEVRFEESIDVLRVIQDFNILKENCLLIPIDFQRKVFRIESKDIKSFIHDKDIDTKNFILLNEGNQWGLIKNQYNKLIGIGSYAVKHMKRNCYLTFGGIKILYSLTDEKKTVTNKL